MNEVLGKNLELLKQYQQPVYEKLMRYVNGQLKPQNNLVERILLARQDEMTINLLVISKGREYIICDHENPINQAYAWIDKYADPSNKIDVVFGMGFGYHLEVLITSFKNKKVIIIEPNMDLFYQISCVRNLEPIIKNTEILLDESMDVILGRLGKLFWEADSGGIQCEPFEVYAEIFSTEWEELRSRFLKQAENFSVDFATRRMYGDLWIHNNIKNASKLSGVSDAMGLTGNFKGIPAVLVSAGPSLEKNLPLLKSIKDKCIIMAAGVAVGILEKNGITPHFMVGIDATEEEEKIHKAVKSNEIFFIYTNQIATGSVNSYTGPKFFMNYPTDLFSAEFLRFAGINSELFLSGPSVSNTCFDILFKMGCNPVILLGQDLAYTNIDVKNPDSSFDKSGKVIAEDIYGNPVFTSTVFLSMRNWFEGYFEKLKDRVEIINATGGGLNIQFAHNENFGEVIERLNFKTVDLPCDIRHIYENSRFPEDLPLKFNEYRKLVGCEIDRLEEYCKEQMRIVNLIEKDVYSPRKDRKTFDKMAGRVGELTGLVMNSAIYNTLLKNVVDIDFYLVKLEVDKATAELTDYRDVKRIYTKAMKYQSDILMDKLKTIREYLFK